jgi:hypothetical protein
LEGNNAPHTVPSEDVQESEAREYPSQTPIPMDKEFQPQEEEKPHISLPRARTAPVTKAQQPTARLEDNHRNNLFNTTATPDDETKPGIQQKRILQAQLKDTTLERLGTNYLHGQEHTLIGKLFRQAPSQVELNVWRREELHKSFSTDFRTE